MFFKLLRIFCNIFPQQLNVDVYSRAVQNDYSLTWRGEILTNESKSREMK